MPLRSSKNNVMSKILVTGAAGFIGQEVCKQLVSHGIEVIALDNFDNYYNVQLKQWRWKLLEELDSTVTLNKDIRNKEDLNKIFKAYDISAVINLAAMAGVRNSIENPLKYYEVNAIGALNVLEVMRMHNVTKIVQASTSSLYAGLTMPFVESADVRTPISPYAASKLATESLLFTYSQIHSFECTVLRYFTVYGPGGRPDMAPFKFAEWIRRDRAIQLFGDGTQTRDFTHVHDIAAGTVIAATKKMPPYEIINLGGGEKPVSILNFIEEIALQLRKKPVIENLPRVKADMLHTSANIEKAKRILGWKPVISLEEGIHQLARWHIKWGEKFL